MSDTPLVLAADGWHSPQKWNSSTGKQPFRSAINPDFGLSSLSHFPSRIPFPYILTNSYELINNKKYTTFEFGHGLLWGHSHDRFGAIIFACNPLNPDLDDGWWGGFEFPLTTRSLGTLLGGGVGGTLYSRITGRATVHAASRYSEKPPTGKRPMLIVVFDVSVCEYYVHSECVDFAAADCRENATYVPEVRLADVRHRHHWREGNLTPATKCVACRKACWSAECLTGYRCEWCGITVSILSESHLWRHQFPFVLASEMVVLLAIEIWSGVSNLLSPWIILSP